MKDYKSWQKKAEKKDFKPSISLKERLKKMTKFIEDNNLSDEKTFQSTDIPKDENGFIDFKKVKL
tara:strand:+ start:732 stop:926 length:195 start_codon:yes stop_codon:yes gene_type:complete